MILRTIRSYTVAIVVLLSAMADPASAVPTLHYDIVTNGEVNGSLEVEQTATRTIAMRNRYQSQDKVRELKVEVRLDRAGMPVLLDRVGQSFAYQPIDEHFRRDGPTASWRNRIENQSDVAASGRYYVPLGLAQPGDSAAYELGLLAAAALRAPGGRLSLMPVGSVEARVVNARTLAIAGATQRIRLVRLSGLTLEPEYVWLDASGRLFAGRGAIRRGWRSSLTELDEVREAADAEQITRAFNRSTLTSSSPNLVILDVALFDAQHEQLLPGRDVLIRDGRIAEIAAHGALRSGLAGAQRIEGRGRTLLPGLWDMHVHVGGPREALRHLATGVTTVRDMGNRNDELKLLIDRLNRGELPGPTIIRSGFIEGRSPSATYTGRLVENQEQAVAAVKDYAAEGFAQIKLYNAVRPEWLPAIKQAAHAGGMRLSGHVPFGARAEDVINEGYDEIQHWVFLMLNFAPQPVTTGLTFTAARVASSMDFRSPPFESLLHKLKDRKTVMDMTLAVYEPLLRSEAGTPAPVFARTAVTLPPAMLRQVATGPLPTPSDLTDAQFRGAYDKALELTRLLDQRGIQLVAGTDFQPLAGLAFPRELELMVEAGLSPSRALKIATLDAARVMGKDHESGSIAVGKTADLALVEGDPTADISQVRKVERVIKAGRSYDPKALLAASGLQ